MDICGMTFRKAGRRDILCTRPAGHKTMHSDGVDFWIAGVDAAIFDKTGRVDYMIWWDDNVDIDANATG